MVVPGVCARTQTHTHTHTRRPVDYYVAPTPADRVFGVVELQVPKSLNDIKQRADEWIKDKVGGWPAKVEG